MPKTAVVVSLVLFNRTVADITALGLGFTVWSMLYLYALISAIADGLTGLLMLTGLHMSESFEAPMLARSSSDFWGRRWNRFVTRWAFSNVFVPAGGRRRPVRATILVFAISGLMHEYLVVACGHGFGSYTGWMLMFFILHGLGVVLVSRVPWELPRPIATALHTGLMVVTAPLFFVPLDEAVGYSRWWKVFLA
ncbi:MAG: MBOAT family protein [Nannocystales bacterium]